MKKITAILFILSFQTLLFAQDSGVVNVSHTLRWETESRFPNYFLMREVRDSIFDGIRKDLALKLNVTDLSFPANVEYRIINGFSKPKNQLKKTAAANGCIVDIFSFISKKTAGYAVNWSVKVVIRKNDQLVISKEVTHEIENFNSGAYLTEKRWMSPLQFQDIFLGLFREAVAGETVYQDKIIVGTPESQEKEVRSWFPNSNRYLLKVNGAMQSAENFAACVVAENDTALKFVYRNKPSLVTQSVSLKPIFAGLFTQITGLGTNYTITEKERRRGAIEFSTGANSLIQLDWIEEITSSTTSDEVEIRSKVPMLGQIFIDKTPSGCFIYEEISKIISSAETKVKFSPVSGQYTENSFGTVLIHRISGTLFDRKFTAE